jgi:hypothetical protein
MNRYLRKQFSHAAARRRSDDAFFAPLRRGVKMLSVEDF